MTINILNMLAGNWLFLACKPKPRIAIKKKNGKKIPLSAQDRLRFKLNENKLINI